MRYRARLWLPLTPLAAVAARLRAQPTSQTQASASAGDEAAAKVEVGAGTQSEVTTGSSGPQKPGGDGANRRAMEGAGKATTQDTRQARMPPAADNPRAARDGEGARPARRAEPR